MFERAVIESIAIIQQSFSHIKVIGRNDFVHCFQSANNKTLIVEFEE